MNFPQKSSELIDLLSQVLHFKLFDLNQTPITVASILMFVLVIAMFFVISRIFNRLLLGKILERFQLDWGVRYNMVRASHYGFMILGTVVAFQFVGIDLSGLAVVFGLLSVGIGFGLQNVTSNFISGLILLLERPIQVGDRVTVGDTEGDVVAINMRSTTIRTLKNITIIVPNSDFISSSVVNWSHGDRKIRLDIPIGVSYDSDLDRVLDSLSAVAGEDPGVLKSPAPDVLLRGFGDSSWDMELRAWIANPRDYYRTISRINCAIIRKFRENGIEIPYPQRDLHVRSPLPVPFAAQQVPE
jgi:small-conductance mechanosensitive channel